MDRLTPSMMLVSVIAALLVVLLVLTPPTSAAFEPFSGDVDCDGHTDGAGWKNTTSTSFPPITIIPQDNYGIYTFSFGLITAYTTPTLIHTLELRRAGEDVVTDEIAVVPVGGDLFHFNITTPFNEGPYNFTVVVHQHCGATEERSIIINVPYTPPRFHNVPAMRTICNEVANATYPLFPNMQLLGPSDLHPNITMQIRFITSAASPAPRWVVGDQVFLDLPPEKAQDFVVVMHDSAGVDISLNATTVPLGLTRVRWEEALLAMKLQNTHPIETWGVGMITRYIRLEARVPKMISFYPELYTLHLLPPQLAPGLSPNAPATPFNWYRSPHESPDYLYYSALAPYLQSLPFASSIVARFANGTDASEVIVPATNRFRVLPLPVGPNDITLFINTTVPNLPEDSPCTAGAGVIEFSFTITQNKNYGVTYRPRNGALGTIDSCALADPTTPPAAPVVTTIYPNFTVGGLNLNIPDTTFSVTLLGAAEHAMTDEIFVDMDITTLADITTTKSSAVGDDIKLVFTSTDPVGITGERLQDIMRAVKFTTTRTTPTQPVGGQFQFYQESLYSDVAPTNHTHAINFITLVDFPMMITNATLPTLRLLASENRAGHSPPIDFSYYVQYNPNLNITATFQTADGVETTAFTFNSVMYRLSLATTITNLSSTPQHFKVILSTQCGRSVELPFSILVASGGLSLASRSYNNPNVCWDASLLPQASGGKVYPTIAFDTTLPPTTSLETAEFAATVHYWHDGDEWYYPTPPDGVEIVTNVVMSSWYGQPAPRATLTIQPVYPDVSKYTIDAVLTTLRSIEFRTTNNTTPYQRGAQLALSGAPGLVNQATFYIPYNILSPTMGLPMVNPEANNFTLILRPVQNKGTLSAGMSVRQHWFNHTRIASAEVTRVDGTSTLITYNHTTSRLNVLDILPTTGEKVEFIITTTDVCGYTDDTFRLAIRVEETALDIDRASNDDLACYTTQDAVHNVYTSFRFDTTSPFEAPGLTVHITLKDVESTDRLAFASTFNPISYGFVGSYNATSGVFAISATTTGGAIHTPTTTNFAAAVLAVQYSTTRDMMSLTTTTTRNFEVHTTMAGVTTPSNTVTSSLHLTPPALIPMPTGKTPIVNITIPYGENVAGFNTTLKLADFFTNLHEVSQVEVHSTSGWITSNDVEFDLATNVLRTTRALAVGPVDYVLVVMSDCAKDFEVLLRFNVLSQQDNGGGDDNGGGNDQNNTAPSFVATSSLFAFLFALCFIIGV